MAVIAAVVMIMTWGITIGVNYQRMNAIEKSQDISIERMDKLEKVVTDGMAQRLKLQADMDNMKLILGKNSDKLDKIYDMINEHMRQPTLKQNALEGGSSTYDYLTQ